MEYIIDLDCIDSRAELHRVLAETLSFPGWYGHNLDALHDVLTAITEDTHLILQNWDPDNPFARGFKRVLTDAAKENIHFKVTFTG